MGKPILYYTLLSPPSRACLLTAKAIGLDLELKNINLQAGDHLTPEFIKINPTHTIPVLDDNGAVIYDSHAIICYMVDKYGQTDKLYPKDLLQRTRVNEKLYFDTGFLFCRLRFLLEPILYFGATVPAPDRVDYLAKTYELLEAILATSGNYLCGDTLTIADLACISSVSSIAIVVTVDGTKYPKLLAWVQRLQALPYYTELNQKGTDDLEAVYRRTLANNVEKAASK